MEDALKAQSNLLPQSLRLHYIVQNDSSHDLVLPPSPKEYCPSHGSLGSHAGMDYICMSAHAGQVNWQRKYCGAICILIYTGQFWNIPIDVVRYNQSIDGTVRSDTYTITVNYPGQTRQFVGFLYPLTWEFDERQCLYVGNGQGGPIDEVDDPNDPVLHGEYTEYIVDDLFSTDFAFGHFETSRCPTSIPPTTPPASTPPASTLA